MDKLKHIVSSWRWPDYGVMLLLIIFVFWNKGMPIMMGLTGLSLVLIRNNWSDIKRKLHPQFPFFWFIAFFIAHVIGIIYSRNIDAGVADIGMKASLIAVPVFLIATRLHLTLKDVVNGIIIGLFTACVVYYSYAIYRSIINAEDNHWAYFMESYLSFNMHRSYFGTYLALGTLFSIYRFFVARRNKLVNGFLSILFGISTFLTFSKAGILILIILMVPLLFYIVRRKFGTKKAVVSLIGVGAILVMAFVVSPGIQARFNQVFIGVKEFKTTNNTSQESNSARIIMWSTSLKVFSEHPVLGVGTGDVRAALDAKNVQLGNTGVVEHSLNAHNQYLNSAAQLGLMGLIPLLMIFVTSFRMAVKSKNFVFLLMLCCFGITMLFESFLETQAGVVPFSLFVCLFALITYNTYYLKKIDS